MQAYILGGLRGYIGLKNRGYKNVSAEALGAELLKKTVSKYSLGKIDRIICGNALGGGGNITRLMALTAGIDAPAVTIDSQCSSALEAASLAAALISCGQADLVICGGFESSSTQPSRLHSPNHPDFDPAAPAYKTAKFFPSARGDDIMLRCAEITAEKHGVGRAEMDAWALKSHRAAVRARDEGLLSGIVCPICGLGRDQGIKDNLSPETLARLKPVLPHGRLIDAANASLVNDGAALLALCSENYLRESGQKPLAKILGFSHVSVKPENAPEAAVSASRALERRFSLRADCYEVNEAFALIDVLMERHLGGSESYNLLGGALAYGHPYGASGAVILLHLIRALELTRKRIGICSAAAAGGLGCGALIERA